MTPGPLLLIAAAGCAAGVLLGGRARYLWLGVTLGAAVAGLLAAIVVLAGGEPWTWHSTFPVGGERLFFRLDALSALFLALLCVVGGTAAAYAHQYWDDRHHHSAPRGRRWWSVMSASLGLVLLASNGLHFLIAWELFAVSSYFLVTLERERLQVRAAGWLYLAASHVGTLCLFAFFTAIAHHTGGWELGPSRDHTALAPFFWLALVGFGMKAGVFPLHIWLPAAHANAPSHVSAMMSGFCIKLGVYGLVRFTGWLPTPAAAGWTLVGFGAVTALLGIAFAFAQSDLKRLLAYCSVENVGIIVTGLGIAMLGARHDAAWGRLALAGALLHVWNHGLFKSLLFLGAGSVLHATGTREMSRMGGLWRAMPWTAACFALGAAAISALPPLNGFVSEWLVYLGLLEAVTARGPSAWAAMPALIFLGATGALALATFVKAGSIVFLGAPRTAPAQRAHESGRWMLGPMLVLALACTAIGLAPGIFWPAIARACAAWHPAWSAGVAGPLATLGPVQLALAVALASGAALLWFAVRRRGLRHAPTWDCGYAAPSPRMQYSSGSFAGIAGGWFAWVLLPVRRIRRPRSPFPGAAILLERLPETVLERAIEPAARAILHVSTAVRRLQHGRLQYYIAYIVVGLSALGTLVAFRIRS